MSPSSASRYSAMMAAPTEMFGAISISEDSPPMPCILSWCHLGMICMSPLAPVAGLTAPGLEFRSNGRDGQHQRWVDAASLRRSERRARNADGGAFGQMKASRDVPRQGLDAWSHIRGENSAREADRSGGFRVRDHGEFGLQLRGAQAHRHTDEPTQRPRQPTLRSRSINDRTHCDFP